jgi:hypothetical protein
MATVPASSTKVNKAYRCTIYDEPGVLTQIDQQITFFRDSDSAIIAFEVAMAPWTCILGEIGLSACQALADKRHGGAAWIATHRMQEVA